LYEAIRDQTYNELVEMVIRGHDARDKVPEIQAQLNELQQQQKAAVAVQSGPPDLLSGDVVETDDRAAATTPLQEQEKQNKLIQDLQDKLDIYASAATMSARVDYFLQSSSHQLTQYGLQCLHTDLKANQVVVFFRNNHFSTMVKMGKGGNDEDDGNDNGGHLYLLVTDLGYCNTPLVVWEKLDVINGDTEYVNSDFCTPSAAATTTTTEPGIATSLSPEQLLAQSNQNDADYHLALQLSKQQQHTSSGANVGMSSNIVKNTTGGGRVEVGIPVSPPRSGTIVALPPAPGTTTQLTTTTTAQTQAVMTQEAADRLLAMQLAASEGGGGGGGASSNHHESSSLHSYYSNNNSNDTDASYHLARQLQEEENQQATARRQAVQQRQQQQAAATAATTTTANRNNRAATTSSSSNNSNCTIS
jgi:hypothetical protein